MIIETVKKFQMKEKKDGLFNISNTRNNKSFNNDNDNDNLNIDDTTKQKNHPLLSIRNVPFTSHSMSILLYEIVKLAQEFHDFSIMDIKRSQEISSKVLNIPK